MLRGLAALAGLVGAATTMACGGSPSAEYAPAYPPALEPLGQAELELDALERSLGLPPLDPAQQAPFDAAETGGALAQPASPANPGNPTGLANAGHCETACDSLASMTRAASRICAMAGPGDRCTRAEARVERARVHVVASCGDCS